MNEDRECANCETAGYTLSCCDCCDACCNCQTENGLRMPTAADLDEIQAGIEKLLNAQP